MIGVCTARAASVIEPPHCIPGVPGLRCGDLGLLVLYAAVLVLLYKWFQRQDKASAATAEHALPYDASSPLLGEGWQMEPGASAGPVQSMAAAHCGHRCILLHSQRLITHWPVHRS